jgi:hypothetical protein
LIEKPDNPIAFMIEYLHKEYPEEAKAALDGMYIYDIYILVYMNIYLYICIYTCMHI